MAGEPSSLAAMHVYKCEHRQEIDLITTVPHSKRVNCMIEELHPHEKGFVFSVKCSVNVEVIERTLSIKSFVPTTVHLQVLEKTTSGKAFCQTLESIMRGHSFTFSLRGAPNTSTPIVSRPGKVRFRPAIQAFQDQVEVMRSLHPDGSGTDQVTPLDSRNQQWRRSAALAMGLPKDEYGRFGGMFKEAITVACFSKRCYTEATTIMQELQMTKQIVNGNVFSSCCGYSDEPSLYELLHRMAQGQFSRLEFKEKVTEEKNNNKRVDETDHTWKIKAAKLEAENKKLKQTVKELEEKLAAVQMCIICNNWTTNKTPLRSTLQTCQQIEVEAVPDTSARTEIEEAVTACSDDSPYNFNGSDISPPPQRKRRAPYTVSYKPPSDFSDELDDSHENPEWKRQKCDGFIASPLKPLSPSRLFSSLEVTQPPKADDDMTEINFRVELPKVNKEKTLDEMTASTNTTASTTARRTRDRANPSRIFKAGDEAQALFINQGKEKWQQWCPCTVLAVIVNGTMYRVRFDDGIEQTLKKMYVKEL